ncbi:MAG: acyltransferase family protein [Acidimicrobiales bacterium]
MEMTAPSTNRPAPDAGREGFLDVVRAVAVVRVVIWHAFGAAGITYVVAAVPAMFFVFASLLAKSLDRRGVRAVLLDRARRVLLPLWAFAAAAHVVMLAAAHARPGPNTRIPWSGAVLWLLPINDPKGSAWEAGWLAAPLWYLRALAWLLLAAPVLLRLVRRAPRATVALLAVAVFALDLAGRDAAWTAPHAPMLLWRLGDFALYGLFVCLGFLHRDGVLGRLSASRWLGAGAMAAGAAGLWGLTQPVPDGVVNNSHPMHLFVGFAWLALAFAAQRPLARLADARLTGPLVHAVTQRSLTIYLWHSGVIILAYQLLWRSHLDLPPGVFSAALLALVAAGVAAVVAAVGWIEDAAGARPARLWPRRAASKVRSPSDRRGGARGWGLALWSGELCAVAMTAFAVLAAGAATATPALRTQTPPTPSRQPPPPVFAADGELALPRAADERDATIPDGATSDWIDDAGAFPWGPPIDEFGWLGPGLPAPPSPPDPPPAPAGLRG